MAHLSSNNCCEKNKSCRQQPATPCCYLFSRQTFRHAGQYFFKKCPSRFKYYIPISQINIFFFISDDSDSCCGSHVTFGDTIPASSFMRQAAGPTFYVKQGLSGRRDVVPPSRVIDFHVSSIVNDSLYVELEWTAPGNNYDQGKGM